MDISQTAKRSGMASSTLRYYEKLGLIESLGRIGAKRVFAPDVLERLALISLGQSAGLSLDEIRSMFTRGGMPRIDRELLSRKAADVDRVIVRLKAMSRGLRHAARCPARNHFECPTFQRLLRESSTGRLAPAPDMPKMKARPPRRR